MCRLVIVDSLKRVFTCIPFVIFEKCALKVESLIVVDFESPVTYTFLLT